MKKNDRGFSLIEVIMAMLMLSIVMLSSSTIESSMINMQAGNIQNQNLQNNIVGAYRQLEIDFGNSTTVKINTMPNPVSSTTIVQYYQWTIRPNNGNSNGADDIVYEMDMRNDAGRFRRTEHSTVTELVPPGTLKVGPALLAQYPSKQLAMWASSDLKLITLNIQADKTLNNPTVKHKAPGYLKSFFVRTGNVLDCRSGTCA